MRRRSSGKLEVAGGGGGLGGVFLGRIAFLFRLRYLMQNFNIINTSAFVTFDGRRRVHHFSSKQERIERSGPRELPNSIIEKRKLVRVPRWKIALFQMASTKRDLNLLNGY